MALRFHFSHVILSKLQTLLSRMTSRILEDGQNLSEEKLKQKEKSQFINNRDELKKQE